MVLDSGGAAFLVQDEVLGIFLFVWCCRTTVLPFYCQGLRDVHAFFLMFVLLDFLEGAGFSSIC